MPIIGPVVNCSVFQSKQVGHRKAVRPYPNSRQLGEPRKVMPYHGFIHKETGTKGIIGEPEPQ